MNREELSSFAFLTLGENDIKISHYVDGRDCYAEYTVWQLMATAKLLPFHNTHEIISLIEENFTDDDILERDCIYISVYEIMFELSNEKYNLNVVVITTDSGDGSDFRIMRREIIDNIWAITNHYANSGYAYPVWFKVETDV